MQYAQYAQELLERGTTREDELSRQLAEERTLRGKLRDVREDDPKIQGQKQKVKVTQQDVDEEQLKSKLENGEFLEFECAKVVKGEDYVMPPMMQGAVNVDGAEYAKLQEQKQSDAEQKQSDEKLNDEMSEIKM